jgi:hypothetical protein
MRPTPDTYTEAKSLLAGHGSLRPQPVDDWRGTVPLPAEVAFFYDQVGPVDIVLRAYGNPTRLPSLAHLWDQQTGYRSHGETGERIPGWPDDWLVVASSGGDPYIYDTSSGLILFARHGEGAWQGQKRFPNLPVMASCLATLSSIVSAAGEDFLNDDFDVRPKYRDAAIAAVARIVGSVDSAERVVGHAGWGTPGAA